MARLNLTIPDPLYERLERLRDRVNVSRVCAIALEEELTMLEGNATLVADPRVQRLVQRFQHVQERKEQWYQRGYEDGETWATDTAALEELRQLGEEWDDDNDYAEAMDDIDEEEFPTLRPRQAMERWVRADLSGSGESPDRLRDSQVFKRACEDADRASYMRGWHRAARDLWTAAAPALRKFQSE
ncbi:MAG: hypothetical protein LC772_01800 [Chloroflexi bacterium]|nr:hypothetical protein [Chloroflexota bacterium]